VAPLDASSGKNERHRLNHGGDRQANSALWHVVFTRMVSDPRTRHHIERRMKEGRTNPLSGCYCLTGQGPFHPPGASEILSMVMNQTDAHV
jgi:hypothetical protein